MHFNKYRCTHRKSIENSILTKVYHTLHSTCFPSIQISYEIFPCKHMQRWDEEKVMRDLWHGGWIGSRVGRLGKREKIPDTWNNKDQKTESTVCFIHGWTQFIYLEYQRKVSRDEVGGERRDTVNNMKVYAYIVQKAPGGYPHNSAFR